MTMAENMGVIPEIWPIAADRAGIWLIGGPWYTGPVPADSEPHFEIELDLMARGIRGKVALMHSTSWRVDYKLGGHVDTYMVVLKADDLVRGIWPGARPITLAAVEKVGKPETHAPDEAPSPTHFHVLMHGLRHLRYLLDHDTTSATAMGDLWRQHLEPFEPALAVMYSEQHPAA
jgi:hypothetical protein